MTEMVAMSGRIWFLKQVLVFNSFIKGNYLLTVKRSLRPHLNQM